MIIFLFALFFLDVLFCFEEDQGKNISGNVDDEVSLDGLQQISEEEKMEILESIELYKTGKYDKALKKLNEIIEKFPESAHAFVHRGTVRKELGHPIAEVYEDYRKAVDLSPSSFLTQYNLGVILRDLNRREESMECFLFVLDWFRMFCEDHCGKELPIEYSTFLFWSHVELGKYFMDVDRDFVKSYGHFTDAISTDFEEKLDVAYRLRAELLHWDLKRSKEAIQDLDKAIELNPTNPSHWRYRGVVHNEFTEDYEVSIFNFNTCIDLTFSEGIDEELILRSLCFVDRGKTYKLMDGRMMESVIDLKLSIEYDEECEICYALLGNIYQYHLQEYDEAMKYYDKGIEFHPEIRELWYNKGVLLSELGLYVEALEAFQVALQLTES